MMLERQDAANNMSKMLNYTHWVDHTVTDIPDAPAKKKRKFDFSKPHLTGSARSEGYYKMDPREKARTKYHLQRGTNAGESSGIVNTQGAVTKAKIQSAQSMSREARSNQRRQLAVLGDEASSSDLLKFNQLKVNDSVYLVDSIIISISNVLTDAVNLVDFGRFLIIAYFVYVIDLNCYLRKR